MMYENIPRLFTALAEWIACLVYLFQYRRRLQGIQLGMVLAGFLLLQSIWLVSTDTLSIVFWMPAMSIAIAGMFILILLCSQLDWKSAAYCTVRAFLLAEFAASLEWQLYYYTAYQVEQNNPVLSLLYLFFVYGIVFYCMYRLEKHVTSYQTRLVISQNELWSAVVMGAAVFLISNLSFITTNTPFSSPFIREIFTIRTLVDLSGVVILYAYHVQRAELHTKRELDAIKSILQNQYVQYRQSRESIDLINRKYHDLKHQIAVLRAEEDPTKRAAFLDQMEQEIQHYEAQNKTGNPVLDTVLTGKSLYCAKHKIKLTCVANGHLLDFMDVMDICTLFGNALDNAIECELKIAEKELRLIHLEVFSQKNFLIIHCENYCQDALSFEDGVPITTKQDQDYHGYGIKSIRYTAQKYGGSLSVSLNDNWFVLNILIPLQADPEVGISH